MKVDIQNAQITVPLKTRRLLKGIVADISVHLIL